MTAGNGNPGQQFGIRCPTCRHPNCEVVDSRPSSGTIRRRRKCMRCDKRFTTYEMAAHAYCILDELETLTKNLDSARERISVIKGDVDQNIDGLRTAVHVDWAE